MESVFEELGIPSKYLKKTAKTDRYVGLIHKEWLKSLFKNQKLTDFIEIPRLDAWPMTSNDLMSPWTKTFISVFKKRDSKVIPLYRIRPRNSNDDGPLLFAQLMQYISQSNYKNLWREAYKTYGTSEGISKETAVREVTLVNYNEVLRELIVRIYGCLIVNTLDSSLSLEDSKEFDVHLNILPTFCGVETLNAIFLFHIPYFEHNLSDCVNFSPAILDKCYTKPLFIVYQLIHLIKSLHDLSLTLGDITLNDIYLTEDLWINVFPKLESNIFVQKPHINSHSSIKDCRKQGHKFQTTSSKCEFCGLKFYDKVQVAHESLEELCKLWIDKKISNFTYISFLNKFSGRKLGDPNCHYVFPWVTDFTSRCGKNWRDLKKSKYRLNKGDRQLDLTYDHSQTQVPHHVSDVLSSITYYVYMARRTHKSVLCKNVRTIWVPAEYPSSIQRMQEWTPDECIPEFFTDPSVFRSVHDDLDDLDVPAWASSPEDFVEKHREILESDHVSERLHHWIDLTFGYKLSGSAAIKAKNVCLHLVDDHTYLTKSGIVQLFTQPHPSKAIISAYCGKTPPKGQATHNNSSKRSRDRNNMTEAVIKSDEDDENAEAASSAYNWSPLGLSKILSRSRSSLHEEPVKPNRSPSATRSTSLGPKNPTFTSHVAGKSKSSTSLPKDYKPDCLLENMEKKHCFFSKTFQLESSKLFQMPKETEKFKSEECLVQNAFTNFMYDEKICKVKATKSYTFPMDSFDMDRSSLTSNTLCNYSEMISLRRVKELQILGCLIVEIFLAKQLRALGLNSTTQQFSQRLKTCLTVVVSHRYELPKCVSYIVTFLLQPKIKDLGNFTYPPVTEFGLPPPSAHLLLEPQLHGLLIPFPSQFPDLYKILKDLKEFRNVASELDVLYHFDCDGTHCEQYESVERTKVLFAQNIAECKVKTCAKQLETFLKSINGDIDSEIIDILVPYIKELIEDPPTSVLAVWYLFDPVSRVLGPNRTADSLLECILKLYETEPSEIHSPFNGKIAKIYHHSFLLRLIVRLGLRKFLDHFVTPLVEAVGGYKDYDRAQDLSLHTHNEKVLRKMSHLKNMDAETIELSVSDESSTSSSSVKIPPQIIASKDEDLFEMQMEEKGESEVKMKTLMEQLELNIASDLPFNVSTAEEALDATLAENIDQLKSLEELNLNLNEEIEENTSPGVTSPTIPVPLGRHGNVTNISCEIGSRKSDSDSFLDKKAQDIYLDSPTCGLSSTEPSAKKTKSRRTDTKISEMSCDSIIWLSHRLGPVLMARYLSRNLLKMLTLCYVGKENLTFVVEDENHPSKSSRDLSLMPNAKIVGDENAYNVLECLASIAAVYGEKLILFQYLPHIIELLALSKRKLTATLEGGLISCLALLKYIIPYLSDATLMDQLQEILTAIMHPTVRLLGSTKQTFPGGYEVRNVLARKYADALYVLSIRIGSEMTRKYLAVPALQRFFYIFDKVLSPARSDFTVPLSQVRLKDLGSLESLSPIPDAAVGEECVHTLALEEIRQVFTPELAHSVYLPFLKHVGETSLEISLKNHARIRELCQEWELEVVKFKQVQASLITNESQTSNSSNSIVIGNRIDISDCQPDLLSLVSNKMENNARHLKGNWFSYWAHEIGRPEKDSTFNFNQIKLQTFVGHANSVKSLYVLDNENSFMSGSRDKTVKLWSLRSQGDGSNTSNCQWTYTAHKKSILSLTFVESLRLVASCDGVVHLWDPFMGAIVSQLDSPKFSPVNVVKSMPSPSSLLFSATTEGAIKIIDARVANYVYELKITLNPSGLIRCLAISPSGAWIAAGQSSGSITVLDSRTGLVISSWRAHEGEVLQLVTVNEKTLVSSSLDQTVSAWSIVDGKFKHYMRGPSEPVHCMCMYESSELFSATTGNRVGVHSDISPDSTYSDTKLRGDTFKGLLTAMGMLPLNRLLLLGADNGQISLLC